MLSKWVGDGREQWGWRTRGCRLDTHMPALGQSLGTGSGGWSPCRCTACLPCHFVTRWLTFHCAGGLGIWDVLLEVVLAGSAESFLKGWAAGSWLAGLRAEGKVFVRREGRTITLHPTTWQD